MALKETVKHMEQLIAHITKDLVKANRGNKAAGQRVRTGTIRLEKVAKQYRKESIHEGKKGSKKKAAKASRPAAKKRTAKKSSSKSRAKRR